jgi:mutator protein MutT
MKRIDVAIAVVVHQGKILICQRKKGDTFGGFWEFPGGKCEAGESIQACLLRELREELDIVVEAVDSFSPISHSYPTAELTLHPFLCKHISGEPRMIECQRIEWVEPTKLRDFRFPPANHSLLQQIVDRLKPASVGAV